MKLQLLSDLHLEFHRGRWRTFTDTIDPSGVDVLVLAGDIATRWELPEVLDVFCGKFPEVLFVPGNHEFYGSEPSEIETLLSGSAAKNQNLHVLNPGSVVLQGIKFVGAPLWFPEPEKKVLDWGRRCLSDYTHIRNFEPWVYREHEKGRDHLLREAPSADVAITHHLPSRVCIAERFREGDLNHFFCHDMTEFIENSGPPIWLFGHTHDRMTREVGKTTLISNPRGYPPGMTREIPEGKYDPKKVIEIHARG